MKKMLAIFALSFLVFPVQPYAQTNKAQQASKSDKPPSPIAPVIPEHTDGPTLQPKADNHVNADVRVISTPVKDRYDKAVVWINLALAVIGTFGISAAFITLRKLERQTKATEDAVDVANRAHALAEKTAKQQLRAYLTLRQARLFLLEDGALRLKMEIEDSGQTPAYDVQGAFRSGFSAYPRTKSWEPPQAGFPQSKGIVGSGRAFYMGGEIPFTQKDIEGLRNNSSKVLFITARLTYLDIFEESHRLRLQLVIGGPMGVQLDTDELGKKFYIISDDAEGNEGD